MRDIKREDYPVCATNANSRAAPHSHRHQRIFPETAKTEPLAARSARLSLCQAQNPSTRTPPWPGKFPGRADGKAHRLRWTSFNTPRSSRGDSPLRFAPLKGGILSSRVIASPHYRRQRKLSALILFFSVLSARSALRCRERRGPSPAALLF